MNQNVLFGSFEKGDLRVLRQAPDKWNKCSFKTRCLSTICGSHLGSAAPFFFPTFNQKILMTTTPVFRTRKDVLTDKWNKCLQARHLISVVQSLLIWQRLAVRILALHPSLFNFQSKDLNKNNEK
jgi:hypothetical protein